MNRLRAIGVAALLFASPLTYSQDAAQREAEALERARALPRPGTDRMIEFWTHQQTRPTDDFARDIVGEYTGTAYSSNFSSVSQIDITIEFRSDGTFATNLQCLTTGRATQYGRMDPTLAPEGAPPFTGVYRVLSPSQLILAQGGPVTTVSPSFRDGVLTFFHATASAFVVVRKNDAAAPADPGFTTADIAGVYNGALVPIDAARQPDPVSTADFSIAFTDIGTFSPQWTRPGTAESVFPFPYYRGFFLIDAQGLLVLAAGVGGSDYGNASIMPFFDWVPVGSTLHFTAFDWHGSSHVAVGTNGSRPEPQAASNADDLRGTAFSGRAFRVSDDGGIIEIPDVSVRFEADGTFHSNWSERLNLADDDFYPSDTGLYRLPSPRHLVLGHQHDGTENISIDATSDFYLSGDSLCFTSFAREAYFVLKRSTN